MKNISLTEKLVLYFLSIGISVILVISLYSFFTTRNALMSRTFDQLTSLRLAKKSQVEIFFNDRINDMILLSNADDTRNLISLLQKDGMGRSERQSKDLLDKYSEYLSKYRMLGSYFNSISIIDGEHVAISGGFNSSDSPQFATGSLSLNQLISRSEWQIQNHRVIISDMTADPQTHFPVLFIATPVITGQTKGTAWLILEVSIDAINRIMVNTNPKSGLGLTGETYLVGSDYRLRSSSRFIPNSILKTTVRTQTVINAQHGKQGQEIIRDYRNIPVLSSFSGISVPGLNWVILAEIDLKEAMIPIYRMRNSLFFLSIMMSVVFFIFVFLTSKRITKPIIQLRDAAMSIGKGEYNVDIPEKTNDEIGELTRAFNTMSVQVREKTRELEHERIGRLRSVIDAEESERQRLSREIHDGIGQSLIALKLRLESLLYIEGPDIKENINILKDQFDDTVDEIRRISNNLMPSVLEAFGIIIALRNLCRETEEHAGIKIKYEATGDLDEISTKITTYLFRIAQEGINNIIKHSKATEVEMRLSRVNDFINFTIRDNGVGFDVNQVAFERGNGLRNLRERVGLLDGTIDILSGHNQGTKISIRLPVF